ncbi:hypothetical protein NP233_g12345 [Leucocoprinus birnbaumii]|uniref:C2H2-type domain-containing protein n=1 Tax=Leucocoprinus birnbaumii TaxID=56174 RepID=A0AAD5VFV1_9AGAR|nr:hypothetical protein NP233_g12345 [Leucocoprinus birnbaumii]
MVYSFHCPHCDSGVEVKDLSAREYHVANCKDRVFVFDGIAIQPPRFDDKFICKCSIPGCRGKYKAWKTIKAHAETPGVQWVPDKVIEGFNDGGKDNVAFVPDTQDLPLTPGLYAPRYPPGIVPFNPEVDKDRRMVNFFPKVTTGKVTAGEPKEKDAVEDNMKVNKKGKGREVVVKANDGKKKADNKGKGKEVVGGSKKGKEVDRGGPRVPKVVSTTGYVVGEGSSKNIIYNNNNNNIIDLNTLGEGPEAPIAEAATSPVSRKTTVEDADDDDVVVIDPPPAQMAGGDHVSSRELVVDNKLVIHAEIQTLGLYFQKDYKLFACSSCKVLLTAVTALGHARAHLGKMKSPVSDKGFAYICAILGAAVEYPSMAHKPPIPAISGLELYKEALLCEEDNCGSVFSTAGSIRQHHSTHHGGSPPKDWKVVTAQHFNNNTHRPLFRVIAPKPPTRKFDKFRFLDKLNASINTIVKPSSLYNDDAREVSAWLKHTKWHVYMKDHDPKFLRSLVDLPDHGEFPGLRSTVNYIVDCAMLCIDPVSSRIRQLLNTDDRKAGINHRPFDGLETDEALSAYKRELVRFVTFLIRDKGDYQLPLPNTIRELIQKVRDSVPLASLPSPSPQADFDDYTFSVIELLIGVWTRTWDPSFENPIGDPTVCFLALRSISDSGEWADVTDVTPTIAKLFFSIRSLFLLQIAIGRRGATRGKPRDRYEELAPWHDEGSDCTFSSLASLQHYASALAYETFKPPMFIWYDDEKTEFVWDGDRVKVDDLKRMAMEIKRRMYKLWEEDILCGLDIEIHYDHIADRLTNTEPMYGFIDDPRNKLCDPDVLMKAILSDPRTEQEFVSGYRSNGEPLWITPRLIEWLFKLSEYQLLSMASIHIATGGGLAFQ